MQVSFGSAEEVLRALEARDDIQRWYGARAAGELRVDAAIPRLLQILGEPAEDLGGTDLRLISAHSLARFGPKVLPQIMRLSESEHPLARAGAADVLGLLAIPDTSDVLKTLLLDSDWQVRLWASLGLAKLGTVAIKDLADAYRATDEETRLIILDALLKIGGPAVVEAERLVRNESSRALADAFAALQRSHDALPTNNSL